MKMLIACILSILFFQNASAKIDVKDAFFKVDKKGEFSLNVITNKRLVKVPEISAKDNILQVELENAIVWPKINKKFKLGKKDIELSAYQFNKNIVRLRVTYPKGEKIEFDKLRHKVKGNNLLYSGNIFESGLKNEYHSNSYDESYLNKLIKERESIERKVVLDQKNQERKMDKVSLSYSSPDKSKKKKSFSMWGYAAKFAGFLFLMVGGIYGAFFMLKKGALKKNKLGFLNTDKQIEVISKHYLSPKRNLCLVKVSHQVFLVANHENGIEFLSEINEPGKILQNVEMEVVGDNFENSLGGAEKLETKFTVKEDINFSHPGDSVEESLAQKLKRKIKSSRDIQ